MEIVEKPTALAPESYAEKVKVKVPVPIKDEHICDLCDFSFKNRADLKMHYLTSSATKEQKSSKKKRNKKKSRQKLNLQPHDEDEEADEMW